MIIVKDFRINESNSTKAKDSKIPNIPRISKDFIEKEINKITDVDIDQLYTGNYGPDRGYKSLNKAAIKSIANKIMTRIKKSLENICGCKLAKSYPSETDSKGSFRYILSPNPDKKNLSKHEYFYREDDTWYLELGYDVDYARFYLKLIDQNGNRIENSDYFLKDYYK